MKIYLFLFVIGVCIVGGCDHNNPDIDGVGKPPIVDYDNP